MPSNVSMLRDAIVAMLDRADLSKDFVVGRPSDFVTKGSIVEVFESGEHGRQVCAFCADERRRTSTFKFETLFCDRIKNGVRRLAEDDRAKAAAEKRKVMRIPDDAIVVLECSCGKSASMKWAEFIWTMPRVYGFLVSSMFLCPSCGNSVQPMVRRAKDVRDDEKDASEDVRGKADGTVPA